MPEADAGTWEWLALVGGVLVFVLLFGAIAFFSTNRRSSSSSYDDDEEYIRCPECDEKIRESSYRCKYCDARIDGD